MGERGEARLTAGDRLHWRRCLDDPVAGAAAILGPHGADDAPLNRGNVELLVAVLPERAQRAAAIGTGAGTGIGRSEEPRAGKGWVSTVRSGGSPDQYTKNKQTQHT